MNTAASVRLAKSRNPAAYCADPKCLWRVKDRAGNQSPCPKHPLRPAAVAIPEPEPEAIDLMSALRDSLRADRIAQFRVVRVMSHAVETMREVSEVYEATDLTAPSSEKPHVVGVRKGEAFCFEHRDGECDAAAAVTAERERLVREVPQ